MFIFIWFIGINNFNLNKDFLIFCKEKKNFFLLYLINDVVNELVRKSFKLWKVI